MGSKHGALAERERFSTVDLLVLTSLDQLLLTLAKLFSFLTKQATLMRRSTVLSAPLQLVFPGNEPHSLVKTVFSQSAFNDLFLDKGRKTRKKDNDRESEMKTGENLKVVWAEFSTIS